MVIFYKKWKMYNEIHIAKNKMDLNNGIMKNHPPSPVSIQPNLGLPCTRPPLTAAINALLAVRYS